MPTPATEPTSEIELIQHNALTTARYEMTACEMDIVFFLLSKLSKHDKPGTVYELRVKELEQLTGRVWNYQRLFASTEQLRSRGYVITSQKVDERTGNSKPTVLQVGLLASAEYLTGQGIIELEISEKVRPYLIDLKSNFTSYRLKAALSLTSKYAKRVYQLASQWKDLGESKTYTLDEFKYMLNLKDPKGKEPEQYVKISHLQAKVLDVAVQQINKHTELHISYELKKKSRAFDRVCFYIDRQTPQQLPIPYELGIDDAKLKVAHANLTQLGIKEPALVSKILGDEKLTADLFDFMYKYKTGKITAKTNAGGLFLKMHGLAGFKAST
jgi:plasmid replication initiation protein